MKSSLAISHIINNLLPFLLWHRCPFLGYDLPAAGVSRQVSFHGMWMTAPSPTPPPWRTRFSLLVMHLTKNLSRMGSHISSKAATSMAFKFNGAFNIPHTAKYVLDKVEIQLTKHHIRWRWLNTEVNLDILSILRM